MDLRFQMEVISSVLNKMSKFASSRVARRILGQPRSTLNLTQIIRQGQILLVSTAAGVVGADISTLIGSFLLGLFHVTLAEQAELHQTQRRHYLALIDEFQVYQGVDWNTMLAELRKAGGSFGLATQSLAYLDKMDKTLRATVMANIDHLFAFAMAAEDARLLRELEGIEVEDITNLNNYMRHVRASLGPKRLPVFSLTIDPPTAGDDQGAQWIRGRSQQRDARPVAVVDEMIATSSAAHPIAILQGTAAKVISRVPGCHLRLQIRRKSSLRPAITHANTTRPSRRRRPLVPRYSLRQISSSEKMLGVAHCSMKGWDQMSGAKKSKSVGIEARDKLRFIRRAEIGETSACLKAERNKNMSIEAKHAARGDKPRRFRRAKVGEALARLKQEDLQLLRCAALSLCTNRGSSTGTIKQALHSLSTSHLPAEYGR